MTSPEEFSFPAADGTSIAVYRWSGPDSPRAIVYIAHGLGEHALRYQAFAESLVNAGYYVIADDHRGHGRSAQTTGHFGESGWTRMVDDISGIIKQEQSRLPGIPVVLFGHSMGAMLTAEFLTRHGNLVNAAILSGSPGFASFLQSLLILTVCRIECWRLGRDAVSPLLQNLLFDSANKEFDHPGALGFEWLSRDTEQVKKYVEDPLCGFVPDSGSCQDWFRAVKKSSSQTEVDKIPQIPLLLFSGTEDPVHNKLSNIKRLLKRFRKNGLSIQTRFYDGGRHEMLNETNREEVSSDVLGWLKRVI